MKARGCTPINWLYLSILSSLEQGVYSKSWQFCLEQGKNNYNYINVTNGLVQGVTINPGWELVWQSFDVH